MTQDHIEIINYDESSLDELFFDANEKATPIASIREKYHLDFFKEFLGHQGHRAKFVVIEKNYRSKDYLSDYSSYYSTCFEKYSKLCTRLHFFKSEKKIESFKEEFIRNIVGGMNSEENSNFWNLNYIGYVVVKPIPHNFIGFTLLRHYNYCTGEDTPYKASRIFWGTRNYNVNVFGTAVKVNSLAFQEQDRSVSACATMAIWCMLQGAAEDYYVILKSPSEITKDTGLTNFDGNRLMPNEGLAIPFMANAISKNNLVTEIRHYKSGEDFNTYIKKLVHAYSPLGIPIILALDVPDESGVLDGHAVTICGYNIEEETKKKKGCLGSLFSTSKKENVSFYAEKISKLYVHDDQWGPFSRLELINDTQIRSSWSTHRKISYLAESQAIMISVYPKVRISYDKIEKIILGVHPIINDGIRNDLKGEPIWDIQLQLSENYKHDIKSNQYFDDDNLEDKNLQYHYLTKSLPKYIWVAKLLSQGERVIDFVYDATGLTRSNLLIQIISYFPVFGDELLICFRKNVGNHNLESILHNSINSYIEKLEECQKFFS